MPSGATIATGDGTDSITVDFDSTATSGNITVYGTNDCGDGIDSTIYVTVNIPPEIIIAGTTTICEKDSTTLTASGGTDYLWSTLETTPSITIAPAITTTYYITVTTDACPAATDSVIVTVLSLPAAAGTITGPATVCQGDLGIQYSISSIAGADNYIWTLPGGATIAGSVDTAIIVDYSGSAVSGDITVYGTNFCGEGDTSFFPVTVNPAPVVAIYGANISCYGESNGSAFVSVLGSEPFTYLWTDSLSSDSSITNLSDGLYWVTVTDNYGCSTTTDVNILQPDSLSASITTNDVLCFGDNNGVATVFVSGGTSPYYYDWSDGQTNSSATDLSPYNYTVTITDANNCEKIKEQIIISEPTELTATIIDSIDATCYENDGAAQVSASGGTPPYTYAWYVDDYVQPTSMATNLAKGDYYVIITDTNLCTDTAYVNIKEICIEIPTAFTPNNDGAHDTWEIKNIDLYPNVTVEIYNRWGQLIYENKGYKEQDWWDGTNNKGKPLPIGSYIYIVNLNDNSSEPYHGIVTIIR